MDDSDNEDDLTVIENEFYEGGPQRSQTMPNIASITDESQKLVDQLNGVEDANGKHVTVNFKKNGIVGHSVIPIVKKSHSNEVLGELHNSQFIRKCHFPSRSTIKDAHNARSKLPNLQISHFLVCI